MLTLYPEKEETKGGYIHSSFMHENLVQNKREKLCSYNVSYSVYNMVVVVYP